MTRRWLLLVVVAGMSIAADQLSKGWAVAHLQHGCYDPGRPGDRPLEWITRCHDRELEVDLGTARYREVSFHRGSTLLFALRCEGAVPCLSGRVRLGEERPGTVAVRPAGEEARLTAGPDGRLHRVTAIAADGRATDLRLLYRSPAAPVKVIAGYFDLTYVENPGAAWGLLAGLDGSVRKPLFLAIYFVAIALVAWVYRRVQPGQRLLATALALVLGGAAGNLVDRLRWGHVVDFISWHYHDRLRWPTFNVADAAITVGVGLLMWDTLRAWLRERRARKQAEGALR